MSRLGEMTIKLGMAAILIHIALPGAERLYLDIADGALRFTDPKIEEGRIVLSDTDSYTTDILKSRTDKLLSGVLAIGRLLERRDEFAAPNDMDNLDADIAIEALAKRAAGPVRAGRYDSLAVVAEATPRFSEINDLADQLNEKRDLLRRAALATKRLYFARTTGDTDLLAHAATQLDAVVRETGERYPDLASAETLATQTYQIMIDYPDAKEGLKSARDATAEAAGVPSGLSRVLGG